MPIDSSFRRVGSRQNAVVTRARALSRDASSEVLLEGATLTAEAAAAGWQIELFAATEKALADPVVARLAGRLAPHTDRLLVSTAVMMAMSPVRTPSGVLAIARAPASVSQLGSLPRAGTDPERPLLLVGAVDVQDPGNVGAIVRVAEAAGATAVLAAGATADPYGWKALRGAMGSAFRLSVARRVSTLDAIGEARAAGCRLVAAVLDGIPLDEADLAGPLCVCLGGEGGGLPADVVEAADVRVTIPMAPPVESLNVAVAAAVVLYEVRRQRRSTRTGGR